MKFDYHIIILGGGSAGLTVASGAAGIGAKVALVEKHKMGGDCLNYGCVPSKSFLRSAHLAHDINNNKEFGLNSSVGPIDLDKIMGRVKSVIAEIEPHDSKERFESLGVDVFMSDVKIIDKHTVQISGKTITGKILVISTGSEPLVPAIEGLENVPYYTNKTIFDISTVPKHLIVIGGGPIGLELGQGFRHLGAEVTIIDKADSLFRRDEPEVWPLMKNTLLADGINTELSSTITGIEKNNQEIIIHLQQNGGTKTIIGDVLLVASGRVPNSRGFGLEELGIKMDDRGYIQTNAKQQTNIKNIFAAGDVTGPYLFTHMAGYQGVKIIPNALLKIPQKVNYAAVPWTTYTKPEVAHIGYTEEQAKNTDNFKDKVFLDLGDNDRAKAESDKNGFLKIIIGKKGRVIGATLVGNKAGDMIPIASLAIAKKQKINAFVSFIYSYPTEAEIFGRAAILKLNEAFKPWMKTVIKKIFL
jgi:pyruvate/2-oxoglutarate dehydrogenase complex dihydrolipoamide dehydrogenase (E3) component